MPANRRRYAQAFPFAYVLVGLAVLACIVSFCVKTLLLSQQLRQGGERLRRLRNELAELTIRNEALQTKKTELTSAPALQAAINRGIIKLIPIETKFVVDVGMSQQKVAAADPRSAVPGGR